MNEFKDVYEVITKEEEAYNLPIEPIAGWSWNMKKHIQVSALYLNSQFEQDNENRTKRPNKNIIRPIINIQKRTEGFDVKDIEIYIDNADEYYKSFLVQKYHDHWALENEMDTFIDEVVESYVDYGGVLVKKTKGLRPEVVNLQSLAFCDQTNILSGTFGIKHFFSVPELREMAGVWDKKQMELVILKSRNEKQQDKDNIASKTPGKYIEVYEVHGSFPDSWVDGDSDEYSSQIHVCTFYKDDNQNKHGVSLFRKREPKLPFKFLARDKIFGRALGMGGIEELFEAQVWTNYAEKRMMEMLDTASQILYKTTDQAFAKRNKMAELQNGEILVLREGADIGQIDTAPRNIAVFKDSEFGYAEHARQMGGASEVSLGDQPNAGTPFKSVEAQLFENNSLHKYRQGKIAVFMDEIYRDWLIPGFAKEITNGIKFLSELSIGEIQDLAEKVSQSVANNFAINQILDGLDYNPEEVALKKERAKQDFVAGGRKRFIEILKGELEDVPLKVVTNIAGKQKNLSAITDKMVNVIRQIIATPQIRQDPELLKWVNGILEYSGLNTLGLSPAPAPEGSQSTEPLKELALPSPA